MAGSTLGHLATQTWDFARGYSTRHNFIIIIEQFSNPIQKQLVIQKSHGTSHILHEIGFVAYRGNCWVRSFFFPERKHIMAWSMRALYFSINSYEIPFDIVIIVKKYMNFAKPSKTFF